MTEKKKRNGKPVVVKKKGDRAKRKRTSPIRASPKKSLFVIPPDSIPGKMLADIQSLYNIKK